MSRLVALALALMLVLSASAMAAERASDPFRVQGAKQRPEQQQTTVKPTQEPEVVTPEDDSWTLGGLPIEPMPEQTEAPAPEQSAEPSTGEEPEAPVEPEAPAEPEQPAEPEAPAEPEQPEQPEAPAEPEPSEEPEAPAPQEPAAPKHTVQLSEGRLNVREEASSSADVIASLHSGDTVELLGEEGAWSKVRLADGTVGYVFSKYLSTGEPESKPEPEAKQEPEAEPEPEASAQPAVQTVVYNYERNADGSLKLDESGNPIAILPEGATEKPAGFLRDKDGALVLVDGIPVPTQFVPVDAQKVHTIEDALDPHRTIDIYADWGGGQLYFGMESQLIAVLNGYDNLVYTIQWQTSPDDATWANIPGATDRVLSTTVTEDNYLDYWRVEVTITGVIEPEEA